MTAISGTPRWRAASENVPGDLIGVPSHRRDEDHQVGGLHQLQRQIAIRPLNAVEVGSIDDHQSPPDRRVGANVEASAAGESRKQAGRRDVVGMDQRHRTAGGGAQQA